MNGNVIVESNLKRRLLLKRDLSLTSSVYILLVITLVFFTILQDMLVNNQVKLPKLFREFEPKNINSSVFQM